MRIELDDLSGQEITTLLRQHLQNLSSISPPESVHALSIEGLRQPHISVYSAWQDGELIGCGALKELSSEHAEIKSMRTVAAHLRKGVASRVLQHLLDEAKRRGYRKVSLETGSMKEFEPARRLYLKFGFKFCGPFEGYVEDPNSVFMTMKLAEHPTVS
jgi:putative acetyltransferase